MDAKPTSARYMVGAKGPPLLYPLPHGGDDGYPLSPVYRGEGRGEGRLGGRHRTPVCCVRGTL